MTTTSFQPKKSFQSSNWFWVMEMKGNFDYHTKKGDNQWGLKFCLATNHYGLSNFQLDHSVVVH
jgi:hypothetical protein